MSKVRVIVKPGGFVAISIMAMVLTVIATFVVATQPERFQRLVRTITKATPTSTKATPTGTQATPTSTQATPMPGAWVHPATVSASNVFMNDSAYAALKACDGDTTTRWATDSGTKQAWLQADFAPVAKIKGVHISEVYAKRVRKFEIQYRAPGKTEWITLAAGTQTGGSYEAPFPPVQAQAIRLNILDASDAQTIEDFSFQAAN